MRFASRNSPSHELLQHEVFFEERMNTLEKQQLFLGRAFTHARSLAAVLVTCAMMSGLVARAAWMQTFSGQAFLEQAEENRLRRLPIPPRRGIIRDRMGRTLADNVSHFQVTLTPQGLPRDAERLESILATAARLVGRPLLEIQTFAHATGSARGETVSIASDLPYDQAMAFAVALPDLPGFNLEVGAKRRYPESSDIESLSHVLGYLGKLSPDEYRHARELGYRRNDELGITGVEKSYESYLRGTLGERVHEVDAHGRIIALVGDTAPKDGQDLDLTLDIELQARTEKALRSQMKRAGTERGAVVALDPRDGSIIALVSLPAYDNNWFSGSVSSTYYGKISDDPNQPLFPRAWAGTYPSGSTVKIVIAAAALIERIVSANTTVFSVGGIRVGPWFFPDWKAGGHGPVNVRSAIAWSVNTFFYTVGGGYESFTGLGVERLSEWMRRFGLGSRTGLDIPGEGEGLVPDPDWKQKAKGERWFVGDTYNLSIGQGDLLVTPMQVAAYTASIANGGDHFDPHVAKLPATEIKRHTITSEHAFELELVRQGMRDNVTYGSGRALADMPFPVSGKTGTAQWHAEKKTHAWFTAFAPSDDPEIVVTVLLEEGGEGSSVAVPVARAVLEEWWRTRSP